jgi:hypothetical protein
VDEVKNESTIVKINAFQKSNSGREGNTYTSKVFHAKSQNNAPRDIAPKIAITVIAM